MVLSNLKRALFSGATGKLVAGLIIIMQVTNKQQQIYSTDRIIHVRNYIFKLMHNRTYPARHMRFNATLQRVYQKLGDFPLTASIRKYVRGRLERWGLRRDGYDAT